MFEGIQNVPRIPELRRRLGFTLAMLAVYRIGVAIPTPGVDGAAMSAYFEAASGTALDMVNLFSGGALERFSIFALGIMPYISSSIILQLMTLVVPYLEQLKKEGEQGQKKITQYTRYGTIILALIQGLFISMGLEQIQTPGGGQVVSAGGWGFRLMTMITLTSGTAFIMWIGEQISERGVGNGISLIIFAGIVASLPSALVTTFSYVRQGELGPLQLLFLGVIMALTAQAMKAEKRAIGMGLFFSFYFLIQAPSPVIAGWLYDKTANAYWPILFAIALFIGTAFANLAFRVAQKRTST